MTKPLYGRGSPTKPRGQYQVSLDLFDGSSKFCSKSYGATDAVNSRKALSQFKESCCLK